MDDELEVQTIDYNDLNDDLKEQVRKNYQNTDYLVPDDWYEWVWENVVEVYGQEGIDLDSDSLQFDLYRNDFEFKGSIDISHEKIKPLISDKLFEYIEKEWLQDFSTSFETTEFNDDSYVNRDIIYSDLETELFGDSVVIDGDNVLIPLSMEATYLEAIKKYSNLSGNETEEKITGLFTAAEMFFQTEIELDETEFLDYLSALSSECERLVEIELESTQDKFKGLLEDVWSYLKKDLNDSHDYYYTDEYADEQLYDKDFEVTVDAEGNQLEIEDLDGN